MLSSAKKEKLLGKKFSGFIVAAKNEEKQLTQCKNRTESDE